MLNLTASELNRFMKCNGFKSLHQVEPFQPDDTSAKEGDTAHWYCEQVKKGANPTDLINTKAPTGMFITAEMAEYCQQYIEAIKDGGYIEYPRTIKAYDFEVRSRADYIKFEGDTLYVYDFKYGYKIVEPENNWTLIWYAASFDKVVKDNLKKIVFRIYQPRPFHPLGPVREWTIGVEEFDNLCNQITTALTKPNNEVKCGEHCYRCKALSNCPAAQLSSMNAIDMSERAFDSEVTDENLSWLLENLNRAKEMIDQSIKAYQDLALHRLKDGKTVKGYGIATATGNKTWSENIDVDMVKMLTGVDITTTKFITPAQAVKNGIPKDMIDGLTYRPDNGFKLVKVDINKQAEQMFGKGNR